MIKTVSRSFNWASPFVIQEMYCDDEDFLGIEYWYNDVQDQHNELKEKE